MSRRQKSCESQEGEKEGPAESDKDETGTSEGVGIPIIDHDSFENEPCDNSEENSQTGPNISISPKQLVYSVDLPTHHAHRDVGCHDAGRDQRNESAKSSHSILPESFSKSIKLIPTSSRPVRQESIVLYKYEKNNRHSTYRRVLVRRPSLFSRHLQGGGGDYASTIFDGYSKYPRICRFFSVAI